MALPNLGTCTTAGLDYIWCFHHITGMADITVKPVSRVGSSYKDFRAFPDPVQDTMGYALYQAQIGEKQKKERHHEKRREYQHPARHEECFC